MAGVKTHVVDILRDIPLEGLEIVYFYSLTRSDNGFLEDLQAIKARGIRCHEVPMRVELRVADDLRAFLQLWKLLREFRPQVLHLHSSKASGLGRLVKLALFPQPAVVYTPNAMACYRSAFYLWLERGLGWFTDVLIAVSASDGFTASSGQDLPLISKSLSMQDDSRYRLSLATRLQLSRPSSG